MINSNRLDLICAAGSQFKPWKALIEVISLLTQLLIPTSWLIVKRLLWWLIAGTRGGVNRARIIMALNDRPYNANQLTELLNLDYKTIRHHLDILLENSVVVSQGDGYGTLYFLTRDMEASYDQFESIWNQISTST